MAFEIILTAAFRKSLKHIAKKHRGILSDVNKLIDQLVITPQMGSDLGQNVYKIRLSITGTSKGKSGGARVITYIKVHKQTVVLVEIYLKNEFDTVDISTIINSLTDEGLIE